MVAGARYVKKLRKHTRRSVFLLPVISFCQPNKPTDVTYAVEKEHCLAWLPNDVSNKRVLRLAEIPGDDIRFHGSALG